MIENRLQFYFKKISVIFSFLAILIGLAALAGYLFHNQTLKSIIPGIVAMNPFTAIAFISAGISLLIMIVLYDRKIVRYFGIFLASAVALIGLTKLIGIIFGIDVYFDHSIFTPQLNDLVTGFQNRIAPNTALNFLLTGSSLLILYRKKQYRLANSFSVTTFFIALLAILGYLYGVNALTGFLKYIPMALNTAFGFILISLAAIFANPAEGIMSLLTSKTAGGAAVRRLIPAAIILPSLLGYFRLLANKYNLLPLELALALLIVANIVVFSILIWQVAIKLRKADEEILEAKAKDEALLESIGEGLIATDPNFKVLVINPAAEIMLGWSNEKTISELANLPVIENAEGEPVEDKEQPFFIALSSGKKFAADITSKNIYYYRRKDGSRFPVAITATPVILSGKPIGVIVVFRDITKEIELEKAKDEFISLASHQLKTPPAAINWNLELLIDGTLGPLNPEQKKVLEEVHTISKKMIEVVEAMLNVSRIELGTFIVNPEPVNFKEVIAGILREAEPQITRKRLKIGASYDPSVPMIPADPGLAKVICENIISNAIKYTPEGGSVETSLTFDSQAQSILIKVKDTGYGIPKDQQNMLFSKMFRANNVKDKIDGTGFGLYFVKSVIEFANGKIWFDSEEGKGTTFYIQLPIAGMKKKEGTSKLVSVKKS